jgi:hypothetical protein
MQHHSNIPRTRTGAASAILPNTAIRRSSETHHCSKQDIDSGFYGVGLPHVAVEATIAMTNKLLMHFGCSTATGRFMQISYSLLLVELGMSFQPLQVDYEKYSHLVTHTWMKMLWEKVSMFGIIVTTPLALN